MFTLAEMVEAFDIADVQPNPGEANVTAGVHLPVPLARWGMRWLRRFGGTRVNLFVTDVPGPPAPLWLAGARMLEAVPVDLVQRLAAAIGAHAASTVDLSGV